MKKTLLLSVVALGLLEACSSSDTREVQFKESYNQGTQIALNVSSIDVLGAFSERGTSKLYNDMLFKEVEKWARDRFLPSGSQDVGVVKISELSIEERNISGSKGNLFVPGKDEYLGTLSVRVSINDGLGFEKSYVENSVKRSVIIPTNVSLLERENRIKELVMLIIRDLDARLSTNIKEHLGFNVAS